MTVAPVLFVNFTVASVLSGITIFFGSLPKRYISEAFVCAISSSASCSSEADAFLLSFATVFAVLAYIPSWNLDSVEENCAAVPHDVTARTAEMKM